MMSRIQANLLSECCFFPDFEFGHKIFPSFSQNAEEDWNGFDPIDPVAEKKPSTENIKPRSSAAKVKANSSVDDFSSLDVKSKAAPAPKPKNDKEDDLWDMLNS